MTVFAVTDNNKTTWYSDTWQ